MIITGRFLNHAYGFIFLFFRLGFHICENYS